MCGRYASTHDPGDLALEFDAEVAIDDEKEAPPPDYNVAPTKPVYVVRERHSEPERQVTVMRWGLVPSWASDPKIGSRFLNARSETLLTSNAFKKAAVKRRCLVPADGWYEWQQRADAPGKQPYFMTPEDGSLLAFAGLYEFWRPSRDSGEWLMSCTIVTAEATGALAEIHDRMPLVMPRNRWQAWLDPERIDPKPLLAPDPELLAALELRPVGQAVGNVDNNGPELLARAEPTPPQTLF
jgi:putative SOS response-associated peptidase YedK